MKVALARTKRTWPWPVWATVIVGVWLALLAGLVCLQRFAHTNVTTCQFHRATGLPCPTCGLTRGVLALLHGDVLAAIGYNPLFMSILVMTAIWLIARLALGVTLRVQLTGREKVAAWVTLGVAIVVNWLYLIRYVG